MLKVVLLDNSYQYSLAAGVAVEDTSAYAGHPGDAGACHSCRAGE